MKKNMSPIFFLYNTHDSNRKSTYIKFQVSNTRYDRGIWLMTRQMIFESRANDIFWIFSPQKKDKEQIDKHAKHCC